MDFSEAMTKAKGLAIASVWHLAAIAKETADVPGDIVECGTYKGGSTIALAATCPEKVVYAFDTFAGMPETGEHDEHKQGDFAVFPQEVVENLSEFPNIVMIRGEYKDSLPAFKARSISLLLLDCDLYESYKTCLEHLWPMVSSGGWVILEDYEWSDCPGAKKAADEFFCHGENIEKRFGMWVVKK